jgi:hypothetical protein
MNLTPGAGVTVQSVNVRHAKVARRRGRMITAAVLALMLGTESMHVGNMMLRDQLAKGVAGGVAGLSALSVSREEGWATSWLDGQPARGASAGAPAMYGPFRLRDGDPRTAWCEGAPGDGVGEIVIGPAVRLDRAVEVRVGFSKSPALFAANGRPTRVRVHVLAGRSVGGSRRSEEYSQLRVIGTREVTLEDVDRFQPLPITIADLPRTPVDPDFRAFLALEILEVTPGAKYHDTCISDLRQAPDPAASGDAIHLETPWPAVLPCSAPSTIACGFDKGVAAEWVSPATRLELPCGVSGDASSTRRPGRRDVPTAPVDPSFATLVVRARAIPKYLGLAARCGEREEEGEISWSCGAGECSPTAIYPIPTDGEDLPHCTAPVCTQLAAGKIGKVPSAGAVAALEREARVLARAIAGAVTLACRDGRCTAAIPEIGALAGEVAAARAWRFVEVRKATGDDPTWGRGFATVFLVPSPPATAAIVCDRGWRRESEEETGCGLSLEWAGRRVAFDQDPDHGEQSLREGTASVNVNHQGYVALHGTALRLRRR